MAGANWGDPWDSLCLLYRDSCRTPVEWEILMKAGDLVKMKHDGSLHYVVGVPSPDRLDVRPVGHADGQVGVPMDWAVLVNPDDYDHMDSRGKNRSAYQLIQSAGNAGLTYNELAPLHLHGTPKDLFSLGMIRKIRRPDGAWAYVARSTPIASRTDIHSRWGQRPPRLRSNFSRKRA